MKKLILIFLIFINIAYANNECKTNIYFANGIMTLRKSAEINTDLLEETILKDIYNNDEKLMDKQINKVETSYNHTQGQIADLLEALIQKINSSYNIEYDYIDKALNFIFGGESPHTKDLKKQIHEYKEALRNKKNILVVAHSQGNLFTFEAFNNLSSWTKKSLNAISVASPMLKDIRPKTPRISWDNDLVGHIGKLGSGTKVINPVRKGVLMKLNANQKRVSTVGTHYVYQKNINKLPSKYKKLEQLSNHKDHYKFVETITNKFDTNVHAFNFYMGNELTNENENVIYDFVDESVLKTNKAKNIIIKHIKDKLKTFHAHEDEKISPKKGVVEVDVVWNSNSCAQNKIVNLDLETNWDKGEIDIKDKKTNYEHFVINSIFDVYSGVYKFFLNSKSSDNIDNDEMHHNPVNIYINAKTPTQQKQYKVVAKTMAQINLGQILEIEVKGNTFTYYHSHDIEPIVQNDFKPLFTRIFDKNNLCDKDKSCGCIPCEYLIKSNLQEALLGPISGANLTITKAFDNSKILYYGKTTQSNDIYTAGIMNIPLNILRTFDNDELYVVKIQGGVDIDSDDDFYIDENPIKINGAIHAIVNGYQLKKLSLKVNILSEIAYQVSKDLLYDKKNKTKLLERLDDVAQRIIKEKVFPIRNNYDIQYSDILAWLPTIDKQLLYKDYDIHVEPIVQKIYENKDITKECYDFVYNTLEEGAPQIFSFNAQVSLNQPANSIVGMLNIKNRDLIDIKNITLSGEGKENFVIDSQGVLRVSTKAKFIEKTYKLEAVATTMRNKKSLPINMTIFALNLPNAPYLEDIQINDITENTTTKEVGRVIFKDKESKVSNIVLKGNGSEDFIIDDKGYIKIKEGVNIDYEKHDSYFLDIIATNMNANKSNPISINIRVTDENDTPYLPLILFIHVKENSPINTKIGQVKVLEGPSTTGFSIIGTKTSMPISIDNNGSLYISGVIDYEVKNEYKIMVVGHSDYGDSNQVNIMIIVDDVDESNAPIIKNFDGFVRENAKYKDIVGQLDILNNHDIQSIILSGFGKENFIVDNNGTIRVSKNAYFNHDLFKEYNLKVVANTKNSNSKITSVNIKVEDVKNMPPILFSTIINISEDENITNIIGKIKYKSDDANITKFILNGKNSNDFIVKKNGEILVNNILNYQKQNRYKLGIVGYNKFGNSDKVLIIDNKIVYFPKESFNNLQNQSEEVNIVYEITDNINFDKSLLSLQVINSTLTHVDIKVNEEILRLLKDNKN